MFYHVKSFWADSEGERVAEPSEWHGSHASSKRVSPRTVWTYRRWPVPSGSISWSFPKMGDPQHGWFASWKNPTKIDDLEVAPWPRKPPVQSIFIQWHNSRFQNSKVPRHDAGPECKCQEAFEPHLLWRSLHGLGKSTAMPKQTIGCHGFSSISSPNIRGSYNIYTTLSQSGMVASWLWRLSPKPGSLNSQVTTCHDHMLPKQTMIPSCDLTP